MYKQRISMKIQGILKRVVSFVLVTVLMLPAVTESSLPASAHDHVYFDLESKRLDAKDRPCGNIVYFGTVSATLDESYRYYTVSVYREGDISVGASVDIHTADMTALYGQDYQLVMAGISEYPRDKNILQTYVDGVMAVEELLENGVKLESSVNKITEADENTATGEAPAKSALAQQKEDATGEMTRNTYPTESLDMIQSVLDGITPEAMSEFDYSSSVTLNFKPGEDEKKVSFRLLDDEISEGDENFSLLLTDAVGVEVYQVPSVSVTIKDNEPAVHSEISFTKSNYDSSGGTVTLEVERTGAEYSLVDMRIYTSGKTAKAGVNYEALDTTLAFMPYEMSKKVKLNVAGEGNFSVTLDDFKACSAGNTVSAEINISKSNGAPTLLATGDKNSFNIDFGEVINGQKKSYTVEYKEGDPTGKIMDTSYDPPIEVGCYYFALPSDKKGYFHYSDNQFSGDTPGFMGTLTCTYVDTGTQHTSYGDIAYYNGRTWKNGKVWTLTDAKMPGVYYQYVAGDIESTSNFGGGQKFRINSTTLNKNSYTGGKFDRSLTQVSIKMENIRSTANNKRFHVSFDAIDDNSNRTPKSYLRVYGVAAMYKKYVISISDPDQLSYFTGNISDGKPETASFTPVQMTVKCGAQPAIGVGQTRDIYANPDTAVSNLVFTENEVKVNGNSGKFGVLKGYKITVNPDASNGKSVTLTYPDDLLAYLDNTSAKRGEYLDYSTSAVEQQKKKILANLTTVPYDAYFIDWIDSVQMETVGYNLGYYQKLHFKPIYDYEDVSVKIVGAAGGMDASFVNEKISQRGDYVFHAGDVLDLRSVSNETHYRAVGYEYSNDKGANYYRFPGLSTLCLMSGKESGYYIRPAMDENDNCIEIRFKDGAEKYFTVNGIDYQGLVDNDTLDKNGLSGKNILYIQKFGNGILEKINPTVNEIYTVSIVSNADDSNYVYVPVITDNMTGTVYKTKQLHFKARCNKDDNVLTVSYERVPVSEMVKFTVSGTVVSNYATVRQTGNGNMRVPVSEYFISLPGMQKELGTNEFDENGKIIGTKPVQGVDSVSTMTYEDGTFKAGNMSTESYVYGRVGDRITMLIFNGNDKQTVDVILGGTVKDGCASTVLTELEVVYPDGAPRITDVTYRFANSLNNDSTDESNTSIRIFDDTVTFTAIVSNMSNSEIRLIERVEFGLYDAAGTRLGSFKVNNPDETYQGGVFELSVKGMNQHFHNGDRLRVRVVERKYDSQGNPYLVTYPEVETGYSFYIENTLIFPKTYDTDETEAIDIPIIGASSASASSGLLSFSKTEWGKDEAGRATGYTLAINEDVLAYSTQTLGTKEKLQKLNALRDAAEKSQGNFNGISAAEKSLNDSTMATIEAIKQASTQEQKDQLNKDLQDLKRQKDIFDAYRSDMEDAAREPLSGFTKAKTMKFNVLYLLAFDFIYNPGSCEYVFCSGTVGITVAANYSQNIYSVIYGVPVFVNFTGSVQGDVFVYYPSGNGGDILTAGDFDKYSGNIQKRLGETNAIFGLTASITAQAGVGMCNVLSARGYANYGLQFSLPISDFEKNYGVLLMVSGGIGFDLLCLSINFDIGNFRYGFGVYEGKTGISFLGENINVESSSKAPIRSSAVKDNTSDSVREYYAGTSDMSDFGYNGLIKAIPEEVNRNVLLDDAAERTRPKLIVFEDGQRMLFFIGNRGTEDDLNNTALFYTVYKDGAWSKPEMIADDGTVDTNPAVLYKNGKAVVAWVDANRKFTEDDTNFDKLNSLGISVAVYENGTFGEEITLIDDEFFNFAPQLNLIGDKLYCSYMKRDISDVKTEEGLLDLTATYSTMAYVVCDVTTRTIDSKEFITVKHPALTDPLVFDYKCETANIHGTNFMLAAYTVDEDCNLNTYEDRELFLTVTDLDSDVTYYPIPITNDTVSQSNPALTNIDGTVYLTWLENGGLFNLLDVSGMLEAMFDPDLPSSAVYKDSAEKGDMRWYCKTASELGLDREEYERTLFEELYFGDISSESENLQQDESSAVSISDYRLVTNGDDIYIFYTSSDHTEGDNGVELFGAHYQRDVVENEGQTDIDNTEVYENWGFGKAVQITDYGKVIDEFDIVMTEENDIFVVSNHYSHWIDENGAVKTGKNQLVEIEFRPKGSISITGDDIMLPLSLVGGSTENIVFTVKNEGLITTTGFDYTVSMIKDGVKTVITSEVLDMHLEAAQTYKITVPWTIPDDISNASIEVTVSEHDVDIVNPDTVSKELPYESVLKFTDHRISSDNGQYFVHATVKNIGNKDSQTSKGKLTKTEMSKAVKLYGEFDIPALVSGESCDIKIPFTPSVDDFTSLGYIDMKLSTYISDKEHSSVSMKFIPGEPVCAEINGGAKRIDLASGMTFGVSSKAAPWDSLAGDVVFTTSDPTVATVDENGVISANKNGTTTLYAYYPSCGITASAEINVGSDPDIPAPVYTVSVNGTEHGTVTVDKSECEENGIVTVTVIPDAGYKTESVTVTDTNGNIVSVTDNNDGTYTFVQPSHDVTVDVLFVIDREADNPPTFDTIPLTALITVISFASTVLLIKKVRREY